MHGPKVDITTLGSGQEQSTPLPLLCHSWADATPIITATRAHICTERNKEEISKGGQRGRNKGEAKNDQRRSKGEAKGWTKDNQRGSKGETI
jgi:hypothetical protein